MTLGTAPRQGDLLRTTANYCSGRVAEDSIYGVLHRECFSLFPDEMFADLFTDVGRRSVPPMIVAVVMVLQRIEGLSDREAVDRFSFDARWKYAAGGLDFDYPGFVHTVLVDMRARLAASKRPDRIFEVTLAAAKRAGLVGRRRVLDSTPVYDAVATMDTVTLIRSAIRGLLRVADAELAAALGAVLERDDDYAVAGKPVCDYDDRAARAELIDALAVDGQACLGVLAGRQLTTPVAQAGQLLATVLGQDLEESADGVFRIARRVASDRVISTVDPQARHGRKSSAHGFDGYKAHVGIDPDSEIITATTVTAGNVGDAGAAVVLLADDLPAADLSCAEELPAAEPGAEPAGELDPAEPLAVYGDSAYGAGQLLETLDAAGAQINCKVQPPVAPAGRFAKDQFTIDLTAATVRCPAGTTTVIRPAGSGGWMAYFGAACASCPLAVQCTSSRAGRTISIGPHEQQLTRARDAQQDPDWQADYRATRPKVERKIGHLMRRRHGGRQARVRGRTKIAADFSLLAAAVNLARLGVLDLISTRSQGWAVATA
ncbi:MAG: transposase [Actinomycetota bacterium]|nr:transposase [Actinomycetota bacterium]